MTNAQYKEAVQAVRLEARKRKRDIQDVCISRRHQLGHSLNCPQLD